MIGRLSRRAWVTPVARAYVAAAAGAGSAGRRRSRAAGEADSLAASISAAAAAWGERAGAAVLTSSDSGVCWIARRDRLTFFRFFVEVLVDIRARFAVLVPYILGVVVYETVFIAHLSVPDDGPPQ